MCSTPTRYTDSLLLPWTAMRSRVLLSLALVTSVGLSACTSSDGGGSPSTPDAAVSDAGSSELIDAAPDAGVDSAVATGSEAPAACLPLLQPRAGTYPVTGPATDPVARGPSTATHQRNTVVVGAD